MNAQPLSENDIETLRRGATGAGLLVALSDKSFLDSFKEAGALAKHLAAARGSSSSAVVREVAEGRSMGFGMTDQPAEIEAGTLDSLRESARILESKAPEELEAYRAFVLEVARSVSSAAGGGDEVEAETVEKIESALGGTGT